MGLDSLMASVSSGVCYCRFIVFFLRVTAEIDKTLDFSWWKTVGCLFPFVHRGSAPVLMGSAVRSFSFSCFYAGLYLLKHWFCCGTDGTRSSALDWRVAALACNCWQLRGHTHTCCTAACARADTHLLDDASDEISAPKLETCSLPEQHSRHQSYRREGFFGITSGPHCSLFLPTNAHLDGNRASDLHAKQPDTVLFLHFTFIGNYIPVWAYAFHFICITLFTIHIVPTQLYRKRLFFSGTI